MESKLRILHLDHSRQDSGKVRKELLNAGYSGKFNTVDTKTKYIQALKNFRPDVILSDKSLPRLDLKEAIKIYNDQTVKAPFIVVSDRLPARESATLFRNGVIDYVPKSNLSLLPETIVTALRRKQSVHNTKKLNTPPCAKNLGFQSFLDALPVSIYCIQMIGDKKSVYVSPGIIDLTGFPANNFIDDPMFWTKRIHPDDSPGILKEMNQLNEKGIREFEYRWQMPDGSYRWFFERMTFKKEKNGTRYLSGAFIDITDKKIASESLKKSETRYRHLVEKMREGLVYVDANGHIEFVNDRFCDIFGVPREDVTGKNIFELMTDRRQSEFIERKTEERRSGKSEQYDLPVLKKDGEKIWINVNASPITDDQGKYCGTLSTISNITDRKTAEEQLEFKIRELNTFLYRATHDMRSPLLSLLGLINIAKMEVPDPKSQNYFDLVRQSTERMDNILTDLVDIIKISQSAPVKQKINFPDIIEEIKKDLEFTPGFKEIRFDVENKFLGKYYSNRTFIRSILQNLIDNAVKFKKEKSADSMVRVTLIESNNFIRVEVYDNGSGIPSAIQDKVFDMFFRGNEKSTGTGLGLYIVKTAVDRLGGKIELTSREGLETKFTVYLPL
ncbi:MAG: PAS domain S-box protein [Bacteroidetes bacterium]|nr:PAS domain S-box protein [Bacteroidota bacterium]